jgi:hypothetical protein
LAGSRQIDDRDTGFCLDAKADLPTIHVGQAIVYDYQIGLNTGDQTQGFLRIHSRVYLCALARERPPQQNRYMGLVIYYQDSPVL